MLKKHRLDSVTKIVLHDKHGRKVTFQVKRGTMQGILDKREATK